MPTPNNSYMLILYFVFIALAVISVIAIFILFIFPFKARRNANFTDVDKVMELDEKSAQYIKKVSYNAQSNELVIVKEEQTRKCLVTVAYLIGKKRKCYIYNLDFTSGDTINIPVKGEIIGYALVVEGANGKKIIPSKKIRTSFVTPMILSIVPAIFAGFAIYIYTSFAASYLYDSYPGYITYYSNVFLAVIPFVILVGGLTLTEFVFMKGRK